MMSDFLEAPDHGLQDGYGLCLQHCRFPGGIEMI
jgi:hypothetical protein